MRHYLNNCLEGLRRIIKILSQDAVLGRMFELRASEIQVKRVTTTPTSPVLSYS
jgi:hypothetical protein